MSSFYGGKEGRTYHIVQRYDSVQEMIEAFSQGGAYTGANYGQYVLIDTILNNNHKSDLENGLLYRRGFDYNDSATNHPKPVQNDYRNSNGVLDKEAWQQAWSNWAQNPGAGAIYVGQIVGPQGDSPELTPVPWSAIQQQGGQKKLVISTFTTMGNDSSTVLDNDGNEVWNGDTIKIASVTMIDEDGNVIGAKIAFDIPNLVQQAIIQNDDPYSIANVREFGSEQSDEGSSIEHPFWYKWLFTIPHGKRGQDIEEIKVEDSTEIGTGQYHLTSDKEINSEKTYYILQDGQYIAVENPVIQNINTYYEADKYFTYSVRDYQDSAEGALTEHLGRWPYRVIDKIALESDNRTLINWPQNLENEESDGLEVHVGDLYYQPEYIKTQDEEIIPDKNYYIQSEIEGQKIYIQVEEPVQENIGDYYEWLLDPQSENYDDIKDLYWVCIRAEHYDLDSNSYIAPGHIYNTDILPPIISSNQIGHIEDGLSETAWRVIKLPETIPVHSLVVDYTFGENDQFNKVLRNIDHFSVDQKGNLYVFYSDDINQPYYLTNIGGLKNVQMDDIEGIVFNYTNGSSVTYPLKQIFSIDFKSGFRVKDDIDQWVTDENGDFVLFNQEDIISYGKPRWDQQLGDWIKTTVHDETTGIDEQFFVFYDENGNTENVKDITEKQDSILKIRYKDDTFDSFEIKRIKDIVWNNGLLTTGQEVTVNYIGGQFEEVTTAPINYVAATTRYGDNLLVLYSDPGARSKLNPASTIGLDWTDPATNEEYTAAKGNQLTWCNFGPLGAQYHVMGNYTYSNLKGHNDPDYPDYQYASSTVDLSRGFTGDLEDKMGWLVTAEDSEHNLHLYAYDYASNSTYSIGYNASSTFSSKWYEIMSLTDSMINPKRTVVIGPEDPSSTPGNWIPNGDFANDLIDDGLWFVVSYGHDNI